MSNPAIHESLYDWIQLITGYDTDRVYRANQVGAQPLKGDDYATYNVIGLVARDHAVWKKTAVVGVGDNVTNAFTVQAIMTVSVNVYALDGFEKLFLLSQSNNLLSVRQLFAYENATLIGKTSGIRDLTYIDDTDWRSRYQADFDFLVYATVSEINQLILSFELNGEIEGDPVTIEGTF